MVKEMVKILFPATKNIDEVVGIIDKYRMKFVLNTDMRLALVPDWYMYILVGLVTVIYGMRGMLKMVLQIAGSKFKIKKDKEPKQ